MFVLGDEEKDKEVFALRPMTCPFQYQAYLNKARSYRDLPLRYDETSTLFRNEASGEMHGLIRVRQFTISEGHLMCTPDQLEDEFRSCLELATFMLKTLGLYEDASFRFSKWDPNDREKYIGTEEQWDEAQSKMKNILDDLGIDYKVGIGEAAFYGPKLDIQIRNVYGKEDTLITIQIDQMLAEKFGMEYVDKDGTKKILILSTEHQSVVMSVLLPILLKSMRVHSRLGLLLFRLSFFLLQTVTLIIFMMLKRLLRLRVFAVKLMTEARKSASRFVRLSLKRCLICSLQAIRILKIILYRFVHVQAEIRVQCHLMNLLISFLKKLTINHLN